MNQIAEKSFNILHNNVKCKLEICFNLLPIGNHLAIKIEKEMKLR